MPKQKITKEELIQKSIQVFRERGYYNTSMSDLAQITGLTKGAFYHHFKNKEELMLASLRYTATVFRRDIFFVAYDDAIADDQKLSTMIQRYYSIFSKNKGGCFYANTALETAQIEDTFKSTLKAFFEEWQAALSVIFQTKYSRDQANEKSNGIIADIEGSIILSQVHSDTSYVEKAIERSLSHY